MLKIAEYNTITGEKVELKELEKYGFEISNKCIWHNVDTENEFYTTILQARKEIKIILGSDYKVDCSIVVNELNRTIDWGFITQKYEYELYKKFVEETLYDLIKDGFIIKED